MINSSWYARKIINLWVIGKDRGSWTLWKTCYLDLAKDRSRSKRSSLGFNCPCPRHDPVKDSLSLFELVENINTVTRNRLFYLYWRSKNICQKGISHPVFYGDLVYKLRSVKDTLNFISSGLKIAKCLRRRQHDTLIIERTISHVLGPSTALNISFLEHCTRTNKAVETIWRALSKAETSENQKGWRNESPKIQFQSILRRQIRYSQNATNQPNSLYWLYVPSILSVSANNMKETLICESE